MKVVVALLAGLALFALAAAIGGVFVWFGWDVIAGHDVSLREALGGGLILAASNSTVNSTS